MSMAPNQPILPMTGRVIPAASVDARRLAPLFEPSRLVSRERSEARQLLESARSESTHLLETSRARSEDMVQRATETAASETQNAYRTGRDTASAEAAKLLAQFARELNSYRDTAESDLQRLALRFGRALVTAEMTLNPARVAYLVKSALTAARFLDQAVVRLHPDDAESVRSQMAILGASVSGNTRLTIVDDPSLKRLSVRVETTRGDITSSVDDFFDRLSEALLSQEPVPVDGETPLPTVAPPIGTAADQLVATWQEAAPAGWAGGGEAANSLSPSSFTGDRT